MNQTDKKEYSNLPQTFKRKYPDQNKNKTHYHSISPLQRVRQGKKHRFCLLMNPSNEQQKDSSIQWMDFNHPNNSNK